MAKDKAKGVAAPGIGHNSGPAVSGAAIAAEAERFVAKAEGTKPPKTEAAMQAAAALVREGRALAQRLESARKEDKEPFLRAGKAVDAWYGAATKPLETALAALNAGITAWQRAEEDRKRREAIAAAERARLEAERLEREARMKTRGRAQNTIDAEIARAEEDEAEAIASAPAAELVRSRTSAGVVSTTTRWEVEAVDRETLDLEALREFFTEDALWAAVRAFVRSGGRDLPGAVIAERRSALVR